MKNQLKSKFISEIIWLLGILLTAAAVEYAIIMLFNLHPILSVKIQGLIGLVIIAYVIRMITRMGNDGLFSYEEDGDQQADQP